MVELPISACANCRGFVIVEPDSEPEALACKSPRAVHDENMKKHIIPPAILLVCLLKSCLKMRFSGVLGVLNSADVQRVTKCINVDEGSAPKQSVCMFDVEYGHSS
mmetsp:Transcript_14876/g.37095  ORF Transcript_14876/g.37095 Transcript_14876/m.37095 type:complete len:106 (-) Transcript_14876:173-490(-)